MASPSQRHARAVKKQEKGTQHALSEEAEADEDEIHYLSKGKPFFDMVLEKSHVTPPYSLKLHHAAVHMLPQATVPVVLRNGGKTWTMSYIGDGGRHRFDAQWKAFVIDNDLKCGDACVFQLMESSSTNVTLNVHILRDELPPALRKRVDSRGKTPDAPIDID